MAAAGAGAGSGRDKHVIWDNKNPLGGSVVCAVVIDGDGAIVATDATATATDPDRGAGAGGGGGSDCLTVACTGVGTSGCDGISGSDGI